MQNVGVVILNYMNFNDTIQCVDSILNQQYVDIFIALVDNGSDNDSFEVLQSRYKPFDNVILIKNKNNLGYAKGNNVGIDYLREKAINYIFIANSDLIFSSSTIIKSMIEANEENVGLLVPIIKNIDGTIEQRVAYKRKFFYLRIVKAILKLQLAILNLCNIKNELNLKGQQISNDYKKRVGIQKDCYIVSGSGFLLTPLFFKFYDQLYPETFLYFEEWATMLYLHKANLLVKVVNTDTIIHKGAASTPLYMTANSKKKKIMAASSARKVFKLAFMSCCQIGRKYNRFYGRKMSDDN